MERAQTDVPDKLFYKAAEVCQITDTQPYVLRFWESEFPQLATEKNRSGQRVYRREDIDLILRIKKLLYEEEYTIAGARKVLDDVSSGAVDPEHPKSRRKAKAPEPPEAPKAAAPTPSATRLFHEPVAADAFLPSGDDAKHYRELYESALRSIDELKGDLAKAATARDILRERTRRLAARLESTLEP